MGAWEDNSNQENYWSLIAQKMERKSNNRSTILSLNIFNSKQSSCLTSIPV